MLCYCGIFQFTYKIFITEYLFMYLFVTFVVIVYGQRLNDPSSKLCSLKYPIKLENLIKLVSRISVAEGLNENLEEQDAEITQDAFPTAQHTPDNRKTNSLTDQASVRSGLNRTP